MSYLIGECSGDPEVSKEKGNVRYKENSMINWGVV
jgi:hypothetical protein